MPARHMGAVLPPEIVAEQRRNRARTLRLYAIGIGGVALVIALILFGYGSYLSANVATNQRFSAALSRGGDAYTRGDYASAERALRAAAAIKDGYNVRFDLGLVLLRAGRYRDARGELQRAEGFERVPTAYLYAAVAGLALHRPDLAYKDARGGVTIVPADPDLNAALAMADKGLGHIARSAAELTTARSDGYTGQTVPQWIAQAQFEYGESMGGGH